MGSGLARWAKQPGVSTFFAPLVLIAAAFAVRVPAHAQSVAELDHVVKAVKQRMHDLDAARETLQQIEDHRDDVESIAAGEIILASYRVFVAADEVLAVGLIVKGMRCPDDFR